MILVELEELLELLLHSRLQQPLDPALGLLALLAQLLGTRVLLAELLLDDSRELVEKPHLLVVVEVGFNVFGHCN